MSHGRFKNPVEAVLTGIKDIFRKQDLVDRFNPNNRLDGKTCLVTGANTGLGFAIAVQLAERGGKVIMACRSGIPEAGEKVKKLSGSDQVEMMKVDLSDTATIHSFCDELKEKNIQLDIIILNAGVAPPKARKTKQGLDEMFMVNYLANFILMHLFLRDGVIPNQGFAQNSPALANFPRVLFISSDSHQGASAIDFEEFGKFFDYGVSKSIHNYSYFKLVLNTFAVELHRRLNTQQTSQIGINVMCPGPVNTDIARDAPPFLHAFIKFIFLIFFRSPMKAARPVTYMSASPDLEGKSCEYQHMFNEKMMDDKCYDEAEGKKLWSASADLWKSIDPRAEEYLSEDPVKP